MFKKSNLLLFFQVESSLLRQYFGSMYRAFISSVRVSHPDGSRHFLAMLLCVKSWETFPTGDPPLSRCIYIHSCPLGPSISLFRWSQRLLRYCVILCDIEEGCRILWKGSVISWALTNL